MRYTLKRDDIPLLSQWIKNSTSRNLSNFWPTLGFDSPRELRSSVSRGRKRPPEVCSVPLPLRILSGEKKKWTDKLPISFLWPTLGFDSPRELRSSVSRGRKRPPEVCSVPLPLRILSGEKRKMDRQAAHFLFMAYPKGFEPSAFRVGV